MKAGWYVLPRGGIPFHGPVPFGVPEITEDEALAIMGRIEQERIEALENLDAVGVPVPGGHLGSDASEPVDGEAPVVEHDAEATSRRKAKPKP